MNVRELEETTEELDIIIKNTKTLINIVEKGRKGLMDYRRKINLKLEELKFKMQQLDKTTEETNIKKANKWKIPDCTTINEWHMINDVIDNLVKDGSSISTSEDYIARAKKEFPF